MDLSTAGPVVLETLTKACNQNADVLKPAVTQLKEWEAKPGFYSILSTIFCNHEIDINVRWLAVLYFKNGIDRYWRRSAPNAIAEEEKNILKKRLISNFNEPVPQVATQLAVLIAKIARMDCPRSWPELIPTLLQVVRCEDTLLQDRVLLTLYHVIKALASKRLMADRKLFEEITENLFSFMLNLWNTQLDTFLNLASQHASSMVVSLDRSILALKVLRKLVTFGYRDPHLDAQAITFLNIIFQRLETLLECRRSMWGNHRMLDRCEKFILLMTKVLLDALEAHPLSYIQFIPTTLNFVARYNFMEMGHGILFQRFTVNCLNLMKEILHCETYKVPESGKDKVNSALVEAHKMRMEFFTYNTLTQICQHLVSHYFLLSSDDLQTWESDPECFCQDEGGDSYKFSLRPCTEVFFLALFKEFRSILTPVLLEMVHNVQGPCSLEDMSTLLRKDAVYNAVGLASFDLFDEIDFDHWFSTHLIQELKNKHTNYRIIRRRIIWLIGQWIGVKLSVNLRPTLYEAVLPLLQESEDLVVRLEAANTLRSAVDDFEFNTEQFLPYLHPSITLLFQLLKQVKECDSKMHVLYVISFVIERVGGLIRPHADLLIRYLPILWDDAGNHNMLRCAILTTLIRLVKGLGTLCSNMYSFLIPVIQMSTDVSQEFYVYLEEDGLDLWLATLHNSAVISDDLLKLFDNMPSLLDLGTENLKVCLKVVEAYILLGPKQFMLRYSQTLATSLSSLITDIRSEGMVLILRVVELIFQSFPMEGPQIFQPMILHLLKTTLAGNEFATVVAIQLCLFGRMVLQNQEYFWSFLAHSASVLGKESAMLLGCLLDVCFDKIDCISQPERRKLIALAVSSLLTMNLSPVIQRFGSIINACVEVLHDVCRTDGESGTETDCLVFGETEETAADEDELETEHDKRKQMHLRQDPVHIISLKDYLMSQLQLCQQLHGQIVFDRLMGQIDPEVLKQLHSFSG